MDGMKLPTFEEVKASGAKPEPGFHLWMDFHGIICCAWCGSTNRKIDRPCKGPGRIGLRNEQAADVAAEEQGFSRLREKEPKSPHHPEGEGT